MDVNIEAPGGLRRQLTVKIPADQVSREVAVRLKRISQRAKIPGFRPGKAPVRLIEQQYGASARAEAVTELVQRSFPQALDQSGLVPAGRPDISITAESPDQELEYRAEFEVYPEVQLTAVDQIRIERPVVDITDADIDRLITNLQKARRNTVVVERAARSGDILVLDFEGKLDGVPFAGGKAERGTIEIGSGQMLPDLENGLIGHGAGERFVVDVNFPAGYRAEELRGKTAQFDILVHEVREVQLPQVDDAEFLAAHATDSVDALRAKALTALENERNKAIRLRVKSQVMDQLVALHPIDVPQALVDLEIPRMRMETAGRMNLGQLPEERLAQMLPAAMFTEGAKRRVALGLLFTELLRSRDLKLDPVRVDQALDEIANDYESPDEVRGYYHSSPDLMRNLRSSVLEEQAVELLVADAAVSELPMALEALLGQQRQG